MKIKLNMVILITLILFSGVSAQASTYIPEVVPGTSTTVTTPTADDAIDYKEAKKSESIKTGREIISTCFSVLGLGALIYSVLIYGAWQLDKNFSFDIPIKILTVGTYKRENSRNYLSFLLVFGFVASISLLLISGELQTYASKLMQAIFNATKLTDKTLS